MSKHIDHDDWESAPETEVCPEHGEQRVVGGGTFGPRHDPYGADRLACGHYVAAFGPGDPVQIVKVWRTEGRYA